MILGNIIFLNTLKGFSNAQAASLVAILRDYSGNILKDQLCQFVKREEYLNADKSLQKRISDIFVDISVLRKGEMVTVGSEIDVIFCC